MLELAICGNIMLIIKSSWIMFCLSCPENSFNSVNHLYQYSSLIGGNQSISWCNIFFMWISQRDFIQPDAFHWLCWFWTLHTTEFSKLLRVIHIWPQNQHLFPTLENAISQLYEMHWSTLWSHRQKKFFACIHTFY